MIAGTYILPMAIGHRHALGKQEMHHRRLGRHWILPDWEGQARPKSLSLSFRPVKSCILHDHESRGSYNIPGSDPSSEIVPTVVFAWHSIRKRGKMIDDDDANNFSCHLHKVRMVRFCLGMGVSWALHVAQQNTRRKVIDGRQENGAMDIMQAITRALARMWLGLNEDLSCR